MIWIILAVLVILWAIGFAMDVSGMAIHFLLIVATIVLVVKLINGRNVP